MYLTIKIYRFYVRCPQCGSEITFKTDPKNADYVSEHGAKRNFEPWREEEQVTEAMKIKRQLEEENNPLKALENKAIDSKREIDIAEGLDELRTVNARLEHVDTDALILSLQKRNEEDGTLDASSKKAKIDEEKQLEDQLVKDAFTVRVKEEDEAVNQLRSSIIGPKGATNVTTAKVKKNPFGIVPKKRLE